MRLTAEQKANENPGNLGPIPSLSFTAVFTDLPFLHSLFKFVLNKTVYKLKSIFLCFGGKQ